MLRLFAVLAAAVALAHGDEIEKADEALANDPSNLDKLIAAARARDAALKFEDSIKLYTNGIERAPGDARLYRWRGRANMELRALDDAVRDLYEADRLAPGMFDILNDLGLAFTRRGEHTRAADVYGRCLALADAYPRAGAAGPFQRCAGLPEDLRTELEKALEAAQRRASKEFVAELRLQASYEAWRKLPIRKPRPPQV